MKGVERKMVFNRREARKCTRKNVCKNFCEMQHLVIFFAVRFATFPPFSRMIYRSAKRKNEYAHFFQLKLRLHSQQRLLKTEK
jgi:hypothetical protein